MAKDTPYLDVQQLTKSFGSLVLFRDISFSIAEGQKVGLIAKNGTGKSTLLSILSGVEGYDNGEIIFRRDLRVGMLEQSPVFDPQESVLDACFNGLRVTCHRQDVFFDKFVGHLNGSAVSADTVDNDAVIREPLKQPFGFFLPDDHIHFRDFKG